MTTSLRYEDPHLQRMEQAALWLQRMHEDADDERSVEDWLDWCQRDPLNQQAFDELAVVWESSGMLQPQPRGVVAKDAPDPGRRALAASLAGLGLAGVAGAWWWTHSRAARVLTSEFLSPIGVNTVQRLADGSLLELGGGTRATVAIGARERRVKLHEGELFVTVHHETNRPFLVETDGLEVVATGTAFNVLRTLERTVVTVAEGSVDALYEGQAEAAPNMRLQTGQQLVHSRASHRVIVRQADPRDAIAWRSGMLHFESEPLSEVIATVNRYATRKILIQDPQVKELSFSGTARTDGIDAWLAALPQVFPVTVSTRADGSRLIGARPATPSD